MQRTEQEAVVGGRFEILRVAGSGGMGVVYQARDRESGRAVALKVLRESEPGPSERLAREAELLSQLDHPHIVGYVSHGVTSTGSPYVVMPWLDGGDLQSRLEAGPLTIDETLAIARAVSDALTYLHGRGLIHRDLKPSNLFLPGGDVARVQLIDMGLTLEGAAPRAVTQSGVIVGTPNFIAPEQARGDRDIAPAVDIFALGCVLFECLTGKRLFTGAHLMSILAKILLEDAPRVSEIRPDVPAFLDLLVSRMVDKDPAKRPADGAELAKWLTDTGRAEIPQLDALTGNERRFVTVLVVAPRSSRESGGAGARARDGSAPPEVASLQSSAKAFGVRAQVLSDGTAIVLAPEHFSAADQASLLTRFASHVAQARPDAKLALTTGSATNTTRLPVGQAIDRAVAMVRGPASAHGVRVDDATAALVTARFEVQGGRVVSERASLDPTRRLLGKPTSCVGRERELAILDGTFAECEGGEGPKVVLVTAEAGLGKSRLQHEFDRRLRASAPSAMVLQCRGDPFHASIPYSMVSQVVKQAAGLRELSDPEPIKEALLAHVATHVAPDDVLRVCDFIGELVDVHFDDQGRLPLRAARRDPVAMTDQIGRAFEDLVRGWCAKHPVVVVLEDLHWAHGSCVKLLDRTLWKLQGARLFLLALARPEVHGRFPALFAKRDVTTLQLPPLARRASAELVAEVLGGSVPEVVIENIVERSEGNAFYLEELIRSAFAPPVPPSRPSAHRGDLPEAVLAVAQARLERLEPEARKALRAASVFGDVFWLEGVSALVGESRESVAATLGGLVEEEAVAPTEHPRLAGATEFGFRHALLRGTAYATLTDEDRKLGHRLAAGWLRDVQEDVELVARHWLEGDARPQAAAAFLLAAEARRRRAQPDAAARAGARALLVMDAETTDSVLPGVTLLADALTATRAIDAADVIAGIESHVPLFDTAVPNAGRAMVRAILDRAADLLRGVRHPSLVATLVAAATALGALADFAAGRTFLEEATARATGDEEELRRIRNASAMLALWSGDAGSGIDHLVESSLPGEPGARRQSLLMLACAVVMVGGEPALARGLDLVAQAERIGAQGEHGAAGGVDASDDPVTGVLLAKARMACLAFANEHARAVAVAVEGVALARRAGLRYEECSQLCTAAEQHLLMGDRERSRVLALESNAIARDIGADRALRHNDTVLAHLDRDPERLRVIARDAQAAGDVFMEFFANYWLGRLLAETCAPGARGTLERVAQTAHDLGIRHMAEDCERVLAGLGDAVTSA